MGRALSLLLLVFLGSSFSGASNGAEAFHGAIPKPSWWNEIPATVKPFTNSPEIQEQSRIDDGRIFYKRALLTIDHFPNDHKLITEALYYAAFRRGISTEESILAAEYFLQHYMGWKEQWIGHCEGCSKEAVMVSRMVSRLVGGYCQTGNGPLALKAIDRLFLLRGSEIDIEPKTEIFQSLANCLYNKDVGEAVLSRLDLAYKELYPIARTYNSMGHVQQVGLSLTRRRIDGGNASPCELVVLEAQYRKERDEEKFDFAGLKKALNDKDWEKHFSYLASVVRTGSDEAASLIKRVFIDGYYNDKFPRWEKYYAYESVIYNMVCIQNKNYMSTLITYFFANKQFQKEQQINIVLAKLSPGGEVRLKSLDNLGLIEAVVSYSSPFGDGHGRSIVFKRIDFNGHKYWLPIARRGDWIA